MKYLMGLYIISMGGNKMINIGIIGEAKDIVNENNIKYKRSNE